MIQYQVFLENPHAHFFRVKLTVDAPSPQGEQLKLPAWIPGSYTVRDFSKHITSIHAYKAEDETRVISIHKQDSHTYQCEPVEGALCVEYTVYAWDRSVRGAHFDSLHAFFNGTALFLAVLSQPDSTLEVVLHPPERTYENKLWQVATTLPIKKVDTKGFGTYQVESYHELIDYPVEIGDFETLNFEVSGIPHQIVLSGSYQADTERLVSDVQKICQAQADLFEEIPFDRYLFLLTVMEDGYGGLEHKSSSALMAQKKCLPFHGMKEVTQDYKALLGLFSHEYFHVWNVKRIKPLEFLELDLQHPRHTYQLWAFEGFTSYYDDLMLCRSKVLSHQHYFDLLGDTISRVHQHQGRFKQTVKESSFDAWTKFYKPNENTANSEVSYYTKGSLCALLFDLTLRAQSQSKISLDDVMKTLWSNFGREEKGVPSGAIEEILIALGGPGMAETVHLALDTKDDLPLEQALNAFGLTLQWGYPPELNNHPGIEPVTLGIRVSGTEAVHIDHVRIDSCAQKAGLSAMDTLVAIDQCKVTAKNLNTLLERKRPQEIIQVHVFREEKLLTFDVTLEAAPKTQARVVTLDSALQEQLDLRRAWLGS